MISARRQRCRNPKCPCVEHQIPPRTTWQAAEGVPPLADGPLAGYIHRIQDETGARKVLFDPYLPGTPTQLGPMPETIPDSWRAAVERAERFMTRAEVTA